MDRMAISLADLKDTKMPKFLILKTAIIFVFIFEIEFFFGSILCNNET